jgi:hypothetical protein
MNSIRLGSVSYLPEWKMSPPLQTTMTNLSAKYIYIYVLGVFNPFKLLASLCQNTHYPAMRVASVKVKETEVCVKVRNHKIPVGCPKYHLR